MSRLTQSELASLIDHTLLKADATRAEVEQLCREAQQYGFASVCVQPFRVAQAAEFLKGSAVKVCTVVGFPLGANRSEIKALETVRAIADGAQEIDMVVNVGALKDGNWATVQNDIEAVVKAARGQLVKVILESALLTDDEIIKACTAAVDAGAGFVKTSTGFSTGGATVEHVRLMRAKVGRDIGVKASGGIRSREALLAMVEAGANRIGTSSGVAIMNAQTGERSY